MTGVRRVLGRQLAVALALVMSATLLSVIPAEPAEAADARKPWQIRNRVEYLLNRQRVRYGVRKLRRHTTIQYWARNHARKMARRRRLWHDRNLVNEVPRRCRWAVGENITRTTASDSARAAMRMFMNSSGHRANILRPRFTRMGIGVAKRGRYTYIVQRFADCTR